MNVTLVSTLIGVAVVDFEQYQYLKLYILQDIKGQDSHGQKTHPVKLHDLKLKDHVVSLIGKTCELTGSMQSDDKGNQNFVASSIRSIADNKVKAS